MRYRMIRGAHGPSHQVNIELRRCRPPQFLQALLDPLMCIVLDELEEFQVRHLDWGLEGRQVSVFLSRRLVYEEGSKVLIPFHGSG